MFYQKLPLYNPQFEQGKPYKKIAGNNGNSTNYGKFTRSGSGSEDGLRFPGNVLTFPAVQRTVHPTQKPVALCEYFIKTLRVFHQNLHPARRGGGGHLRGLCHNSGCRPQHGPPLHLF